MINNPRAALKQRHGRQQRGAVAVMLGLLIFVLFGFMALAIDLGRTYVVRTELQNAADAAALAGAQQLDQTDAGVTRAVNQAIAIAAQNSYKFYSPVSLTIDNILLGSCPADGTCTMVAASSVPTVVPAAGLTFLQVNAASGALATFFAKIPTTSTGTGIASTSTYGQAIAGPFVTQILPMGVCAIDAATPGGIASNNELTEFGFRRGIAYNLASMNQVSGNNGNWNGNNGNGNGNNGNGNNGNGNNATTTGPIWLNPLKTFPSTCGASLLSANAMNPFVCNGTSTVITSLSSSALGSVFVNTAVTPSQMELALNSRFDNYTSNVCNASNAPPDVNIQAYTVPAAPGAGTSGNPRDWMEPGGSTYPVNQSITLSASTFQPVTNPSTAQYGALWAYSRAVNAVGKSPNATAGAVFGLSDWSNLYSGNTADTTTSGYPSSPATSPYSTSSGSKYFAGPIASHTGQSNRRVLNVVLLDCAKKTSNTSCANIAVVGVGKFFMPTPASLTGTPPTLNAEFAGLLTTLPAPAVRLYK